MTNAMDKELFTTPMEDKNPVPTITAIEYKPIKKI